VGANAFENTIKAGTAKFLTLSWVGVMGDLVDFSSPAVVNGVVYIGSFDGKLYAFNAAGCAPQTTCQPLWSGSTNNDIVRSPAVALTQLPAENEQIVSSSPAVVNGSVYFGSVNQQAPPIGRLYVF
jgi:outer membrane protein assembly factor BamB